MKKQKKILIQFIVFITLLLSSCQVFATDISQKIMKAEFTEEFLEYLELNNEERKNTIMPRPYEIAKTTTKVTNPLKIARMLGSTSTGEYSLKTIIPENMVIKNQQDTNSCWTFSALAALESSLALKDKKMGNTTVVYDFSERHMEYATSYTFKNANLNQNGFKREVNSGGNLLISLPYLTNGTGAIAESDMPFQNNIDKIPITDLEGKTVLTQVNDAVIFPSYTANDDKTEIIKQMKNHIMNYGAIDVAIHGMWDNNDCYNESKGAIYCDHDIPDGEGHAVAIVGWKDDFGASNFKNSSELTSDGAWIIKNSWGADVGDDGFMYISYEDNNVYLQMSGIIDAQSEVEYENIYQYDEYGGNVVWGDYVQTMHLATVFNRATTGTEYLTQVSIFAPETYTCKVYVNPNGTSKAIENLIPVQLETGETETFEAGYHTIEFLEPIKINSNDFVVVLEIKGTQEDLITAMFEANPKNSLGESTIWDNVTVENGKCFISFGDTFSAQTWMDTSNLEELTDGYMIDADTTIKAFTTSKVLESIEITNEPDVETYIEGDDFDATGMVVKAKYGNGDEIEITDYTIEDGTNLQAGQTTVTIFYQGKTTTQAITVAENVIESIEITTLPTTKQYWSGEDFNPAGMVVTATYTNGTVETVTGYTIEDGVNLQAGQTTVTISYQGKTVTQAITVIENKVESIQITTLPTTRQYWVGEDFNPAGMVVTATYTNGTVETVTGYTVEDGENLQANQTTVTITYQGKTVTQAITVTENNLESIQIITPPTTRQYWAGEDFNPAGMMVTATYTNGTVETVTDYTIENGENLQTNQTSVTIIYRGKTATQAITVISKTITGITIKTMPTKTEYIQNKEVLDLTGGVIEIAYNDNSKEEISMISEKITVEGFNNKQVGTQTITLIYQGQRTTFNVNIKEEQQQEVLEPENSNLKNVQGNVTKVNVYLFTDMSKQAYGTVEIEINGIIKSTVNDKLEYYYYLSPKQQETDTKEWIKIDNMKEEDGKIFFEIDSSDVSNFDELADAENIYLYIKEVATRNNTTKEAVTSPISLEIGDANVELYVDGQLKKAEIPGTEATPGEEGDDQLAPETEEKPKENGDDTTIPGTIPNAGKNALIIFLAIVICILGRIMYIKYKDIQIK